MRLSRVVIRLPVDDKEALDRLRRRYFEETSKGLSRASLARALLHGALAAASERKAVDVVRETGIADSLLRGAPLERAGGTR